MNKFYSHSNAVHFEKEAIHLIGEFLGENETLIIGKRLNNNFIADAFLPEGCKQLEWPEKTVVEIKLSFTRSYTSERVIYELKRLLDYRLANRVILISAIKGTFLFPNNIVTSRVLYYDFESLKEKLEEKGKKETNNSPQNNDETLDAIDKAKT